MTRARPCILLTGANGQVGAELRRELVALGQVIATTRTELPLEQPERIRAAIRGMRPRLIVNAAAYTAVDRAEQEPDLARAINATAPRVLAEEAARGDAILVHYSTDYVFDGAAATPYLESDATNPLNVYGRTKREGELAIAAEGARHLILRTSWVYGARGRNFLTTIRRLARERPALRVVADQVGVPTSSRALAVATTRALAALAMDDDIVLDAETSGIYHVVAAGSTTWFGFARRIVDSDPDRALRVCESVVPIRSADYPTAARRPAYSVLDGTRFTRVFGVRLPSWQEQLSATMAELSG